ncbi:hypothetical protein chiPu_0030716, partial [Chiloscyllium punctatum]|nr:hypothetical protein [Chiloscyllium punctatum]
GGGDARALDGDVDRAGAVLGESLAFQLRLDELRQRREGHVDRQADRDLARHRRHDGELVGERAVRGRLCLGDPRLGLDSHGQDHRRRIDLGLGRDRAGRPQLEPHRRHRRGAAGALQRDRPAGFGPLRAGAVLEHRVVAQPCLHHGNLVGDRLVDHRLDLGRHADADAGGRQAGVAEIDLRLQVRLDPPGRAELRPRSQRDAALDVGVGVDVLDVHGADLPGDIAAEQAAERVGDGTG